MKSTPEKKRKVPEDDEDEGKDASLARPRGPGIPSP